MYYHRNRGRFFSDLGHRESAGRKPCAFATFSQLNQQRIGLKQLKIT